MALPEKGVNPDTLLEEVEKISDAPAIKDAPTPKADPRDDIEKDIDAKEDAKNKEVEALVLSRGQKAVGLNFNPGGDPLVTEIKTLYAGIIDICDIKIKDIVKAGAKTPDEAVDANEAIRLLTQAITEAQTAQMWAVKGITYLK